MPRSLAHRATTYVIRDLIGDVLYFPVWWYSAGVRLAVRRMERQWLTLFDRLGLKYLLLNMGRPMYGDYTRSGKIISFFFRLILVGWSFFLMAVWSVAVLAVFLVWLAAPVVAGAMLLRQLLPVTFYG